ncbi:nuclear transport factor 2 family protein [Streptomyces griseorubiginosus]|uniref:nuclear transport factor 2 family protein n=1 Tax=Streptomyces griseorubiginosus TaxID=67304 RepID=UPI002E81DD7C|nr:nuclear transport factor 2 family protein [Streptomyces griseorubiginosus]WUB46391.1 nuclear transport factor 2 family protein [Streptomyces griseorubiginosus]WUB54912.1 nuclear transport factor 2 family protein [Streptomyces griseorubiginosus]
MSPDATTSPAFLRRFATEWLAAWNSHDTEQVLALTHPDVTWDDTVFWTEVIHGREALRGYIDRIWRAMPDVSFDEVQLFTAPEDGQAVVLFRQEGSGPPQLDASRRFSTHGCDVFLEFTDGLLSHYLAQYEINDMMRQLGALPPRNGKIGGAYLLSLLGAGQG